MTGSSSGRPEQEPRVLTDVRLAEVVLDPRGGLFGPLQVIPEPPYIPEVTPARLGFAGFPRRIGCPSCDHVTGLTDGGSDEELEAFWDHLGEHTTHPLARLELWVTAMAGAR